MRILSLDPGMRTGWSLWDLLEREPLEHLEHGTIDWGVRGFVQWWEREPRAIDIIVCETFHLDGRTPKPNLEPLRLEGALAALWSGQIVYQRNGMKVHAPDSLLKAHGLWWPSKGHDRDSARHAIGYAKVTGHRPTIEKFWPRGGEAA